MAEIAAAVYGDDTAMTAPTAIQTTIAVVKDAKEAWEPLQADNPYQEACQLNQVVEKYIKAHP